MSVSFSAVIQCTFGYTFCLYVLLLQLRIHSLQTAVSIVQKWLPAKLARANVERQSIWMPHTIIFL